MASRFSSDSQGTVVFYPDDDDKGSQSSMDTAGVDTLRLSLLPASFLFQLSISIAEKYKNMHINVMLLKCTVKNVSESCAKIK